MAIDQGKAIRTATQTLYQNHKLDGTHTLVYLHQPESVAGVKGTLVIIGPPLFEESRKISPKKLRRNLWHCRTCKWVKGALAVVWSVYDEASGYSYSGLGVMNPSEETKLLLERKHFFMKEIETCPLPL